MLNQDEKKITREWEDLDLEITRGNEDQSAWLLTYSDIVTLLLCFFIIFVTFRQEAKEETKEEIAQELTQDQNKLEQIKLSLKEKLAQETTNAKDAKDIKDKDKGDGPGSGSATSSQKINGQDGQYGQNRGLISKLKEGLFDSNMLRIYNKGHLIKISFSGLSFFNRGSFTISDSAKAELLEVLELIKPHLESINLTIEGYTDNTPVKAGSNSAYSTNLELSTLRSLDVARLFMKNGVSGENISIQGFGEFRQLAQEEFEDKIDLLSKNRRITLRIESK